MAARDRLQLYKLNILISDKKKNPACASTSCCASARRSPIISTPFRDTSGRGGAAVLASSATFAPFLFLPDSGNRKYTDCTLPSRPRLAVKTRGQDTSRRDRPCRAHRRRARPSAAALVYEAGQQQGKRVLVYDLGGRTFAVSVVRIEEGVVEVIATAHDHRCVGAVPDLRRAPEWQRQSPALPGGARSRPPHRRAERSAGWSRTGTPRRRRSCRGRPPTAPYRHIAVAQFDLKQSPQKWVPALRKRMRLLKGLERSSGSIRSADARVVLRMRRNSIAFGGTSG
ncbi:MAG: Hsp70 family protein [Candidatus Competibacteraceae bacterium]|nr:Hsp70 family protein [Candidatus Competibacteraceae bacterium]